MSSAFQCSICLKGDNDAQLSDDETTCILDINKKKNRFISFRKKDKNTQNIQRKVKLYDCGHEFHVDCLKEWVTNNNSCPLCRKEIIFHFSIHFKKGIWKKNYLLRIDNDEICIYELQNYKKKHNKNTRNFSDIYLNFKDKKSKKKIYKTIKYSEFSKISMFREEVICIKEKNGNKTLFYTDVDELLIIDTLIKLTKRYGLINKIGPSVDNYADDFTPIEGDIFNDYSYLIN